MKEHVRPLVLSLNGHPLQDIIAWVKRAPDFSLHLEALEQYRERYGVE